MKDKERERHVNKNKKQTRTECQKKEQRQEERDGVGVEKRESEISQRKGESWREEPDSFLLPLFLPQQLELSGELSSLANSTQCSKHDKGLAP